MQRIDKLIHHPVFLHQVNKLEELEKERRFCKHGWTHFLDVARIAWIFCKEQGLDFSRELIYAAALLHDIGRVKEYEDQTPHESAAISCAEEILRDCAFTSNECELILTAIRSHNDRKKRHNHLLAAVLYEADKSSRLCFVCAVRNECKWSEEEKNKTIKY